MSDNWLSKVGDVQGILNRLGKEYDIAAACSGEMYDTVQAMMALAVNQAVNETGFTPRKRKRIVSKMADWLMNGAVAVFMLGYDAGKKDTGDA